MARTLVSKTSYGGSNPSAPAKYTYMKEYYDFSTGSIKGKYAKLDIHKHKAAHDLNIHEMFVTKKLRAAAKIANFTYMYGGSTVTSSTKLFITKDMIKELEIAEKKTRGREKHIRRFNRIKNQNG